VDLYFFYFFNKSHKKETMEGSENSFSPKQVKKIQTYLFEQKK
jgi:hypothetical protein